MYNKVCKKCGKEFESTRANRTTCDECKVARNQMNMNFRNGAYDRVEIYLNKGQKEDIKYFLKNIDMPMSMNEFFKNAVNVYMEKLYEDYNKNCNPDDLDDK